MMSTSRTQKSPSTRKLKDELAALSKELGFAEYAPSEASEPEVEDEVADDDNDEDGSGDEDEDVVQAPRKPEDMVRSSPLHQAPLTAD